jgi:photosystem II stability/assembly factor-like uncharacterized protein
MPEAVDSGTPLERTRWFAARAGSRAGASVARLRTALVDTHNVPSVKDLSQRVIKVALEALLPHIHRYRDVDEIPPVIALDADGAAIRVQRLTDVGALTDRPVGPVARVARFYAQWAFLGIRISGVDPYRAGALRLAAATADSASPSTIDASGFSASEGLMIGVITSGGDYQATVSAAPMVRRWEELGPTLDPASPRGLGRVKRLDIHPSNGDVLVAGAAGGGVWRTDDSGAHWRPLMDGESSLTIGAVAFAPSDPDFIYAASGEDARPYDPAWPGLGIYGSRDGGNTWPVLTEVRSTRFSAIAVHPWDALTAYVAGNVGLYKTTDGGLTWQRLAKGRITSVVLDHENPNRVYIGVYRRGVYRSTNGWSFSRLDLYLDSRHPLPPRDHGYIRLAIGRHGKHGPGFLITKLGKNGELIYTTTNGGDSWTRGQDNVAWSDGFTEWTSVVAVSPCDEQCLYAGERFDLKRSDDGGASWQPIGQGLHPDHQDLVFDPNNPDRIYLANDAGVYRSSNKGGRWEFASGGLNIAQLYDLDVSAQNPDIVACGAQESGLHYRDGSGQWRALNFLFDCTRVAVDAADSQIAYFSGQFGIKKILAGEPALARTTNASTVGPLGTTNLCGVSPFVTILTLDANPTVSNPASHRIMFLAGNDGLIPHLFRSVDGGTTWTRVVYQGATPFGPPGTLFVPEGDITAIEFAGASNVYLGTSLGAVYRATTNGGATGEDWKLINNLDDFSGGQISAIAADPANPDHLWVAFAGDGVTFTDRPDGITPSNVSHVYKTTDGGANWTDASGFFFLFWHLPDVPTSAVVVDDQTTYPDRAYVGTDTGVFVTTNGGLVWSRLGDGLPAAPVTRLRLHKTGRWLFAATMGRGAYRYKLD